MLEWQDTNYMIKNSSGRNYFFLKEINREYNLLKKRLGNLWLGFYKTLTTEISFKKEKQIEKIEPRYSSQCLPYKEPINKERLLEIIEERDKEIPRGGWVIEEMNELVKEYLVGERNLELLLKRHRFEVTPEKNEDLFFEIMKQYRKRTKRRDGWLSIKDLGEEEKSGIYKKYKSGLEREMLRDMYGLANVNVVDAVLNEFKE